jgi:hypothetical protein
LVAAHGRLITWVADARERARAWEREALERRLGGISPKGSEFVFIAGLCAVALGINSCFALVNAVLSAF